MIITDVYNKVNDLARTARESKSILEHAISRNFDVASISILNQKYKENYDILKDFLNTEVVLNK